MAQVLNFVPLGSSTRPNQEIACFGPADIRWGSARRPFGGASNPFPSSFALPDWAIFTNFSHPFFSVCRPSFHPRISCFIHNYSVSKIAPKIDRRPAKPRLENSFSAPAPAGSHFAASNIYKTANLRILHRNPLHAPVWAEKFYDEVPSLVVGPVLRANHVLRCISGAH